jgi:hypothetical protein
VSLRERAREAAADDFATLSLFRFLPDGRFVVAGAHEDILVWRARAGRCERIATSGVWLGIKAEVAIVLKNAANRLEPDDLVVLYTDGITEARRTPGMEQFGIVRLQAAVEELADRPAAVLCDEILRRVSGPVPTRTTSPRGAALPRNRRVLRRLIARASPVRSRYRRARRAKRCDDPAWDKAAVVTGASKGIDHARSSTRACGPGRSTTACAARSPRPCARPRHPGRPGAWSSARSMSTAASTLVNNAGAARLRLHGFLGTSDEEPSGRCRSTSSPPSGTRPPWSRW